jgi:hypothetical protein
LHNHKRLIHTDKNTRANQASCDTAVAR